MLMMPLRSPPIRPTKKKCRPAISSTNKAYRKAHKKLPPNKRNRPRKPKQSNLKIQALPPMNKEHQANERAANVTTISRERERQWQERIASYEAFPVREWRASD